jgi:hypothetical protein
VNSQENCQSVDGPFPVSVVMYSVNRPILVGQSLEGTAIQIGTDTYHLKNGHNNKCKEARQLGRHSAERRQCCGTQAEEPLPVKTVKSSPGVMFYCSEL